MTVIKETKCDYCGKVEEQPKNIIDEPYSLYVKGNFCELPVGWFSVDRLVLKFHKNIKDKEYKKLTIGDPHFCCDTCAFAWFIEQLNKLMKKR